MADTTLRAAGRNGGQRGDGHCRGVGLALLGVARDVGCGEQRVFQQRRIEVRFVLPDVERPAETAPEQGLAVDHLPARGVYENGAGVSSGPNSRLSAMWRVEASSGVWKVRMSASRATSSSVRNPHRSRSSRGGRSRRRGIPTLRHTLSRAIRRVPRPRFPACARRAASPACGRGGRAPRRPIAVRPGRCSPRPS